MEAKTYTELVNERECKARARRDERYARLAGEERIWGHVPREWMRDLAFPRLAQDVLAGLRELADSCAVSDILDKMGVVGAIPASALPPLLPGVKIAGQAVTQRNLPERKTMTASLLEHAYIGMSTKDIGYLAEPGDVLVVDNSGVKDVSCMGAMACRGYHTRGVAGAVVWGGVRDIDGIREEGFPVWSRGQTCVTGKYRIYAAEINGPVSINQVLVCAGDVIVADGSGVCVVPYELAGEVLEELQKTARAEEHMRRMIDGGESIQTLERADRAEYR